MKKNTRELIGVIGFIISILISLGFLMFAIKLIFFSK